MIKVLNQYFPGRLFVLLVTENALILLGIWAVVAFHVGSVRLSLFSYPALFLRAILITAICQICFYYADIYDLRSVNARIEVFIRVLQASGAAAVLLAILFYIFPQIRMGAGIVESSILAIIFVILTWRILVEWLNRAYGGGERILLAGSGAAVQALTRELACRHDLPIRIIGAVTEDDTQEPDSLGRIASLGTMSQLEAILKNHQPDRLIVALKERRQRLPINLLLKLRMRGLKIEEAAALYEKITGRIPVESIHPSLLIFSDGFRQNALRRFYGRVFGICGATLGLILAGPLMLLIAALIKLDSRGPVFYRQTRVGINGTAFNILKFRSMRSDAESMSGPVWAQDADPRITRLGRWLRKLRLDELPQFINVLNGHMSFVGPRPERPFFVDLLNEQIPFFDLRHSVRPGITGWAQVSHDYGASVEDAKMKLEYDLFYVKNVSISMDLMILFQTIKIVIFGRGAR